MIDNLFSALPVNSVADEELLPIFQHGATRIERIVSTGQSSPPGFWYDQDGAEWVLLLSGAASLRFEDEPVARSLKPGDFVAIAPHRRHRVERTDPEEKTVWLAVHCLGENAHDAA